MEERKSPRLPSKLKLKLRMMNGRACMREAKRRGALTIGIANNLRTPILEEADCPIWLDTGPEPIAGSTRMKAGTAQRVTLNLLSTLVMIRLGGVHEGLMVDVQANNAKLVERSESILRRLSGRICGSARCVASCPSNMMLPASMSMSRMSARPSVVFPEPDSPTMPTVSPRPILRSTPCRTLTPPTRSPFRRRLPP